MTNKQKIDITKLSGLTLFDPCVYFNPYDGICSNEQNINNQQECPWVKIETDFCSGHD